MGIIFSRAKPTEAARPPVYTCVQGSESPTFRHPPLDGSILISEFVDWQEVNSPDHPYATLTRTGDEWESEVEEIVITYKELAMAVATFTDSIPKRRETSSDADRPVVAFIAPAHPLAYIVAMLAISRAGYQPFVFLMHLEPMHVQRHLVKLSGASIFLAGPRGAEHEMTLALLEDASTNPEGEIWMMPTITDLFPRLHFSSSSPVPPFVAPSRNTLLSPSHPVSHLQTSTDSPWVMQQTSGTTGLPKVFTVTHAAALFACSFGWNGDVDVCAKMFGTVTIHPSNSTGISVQIGAPMTSGAITNFPYPEEVTACPPILLSPTKELDRIIASRITHLWVTFPNNCLEEWSQDSESLSRLASSLEFVFYGTRAIDREIGLKFVEAGVNLNMGYGATESGAIFRLITKPPGRDYEYGQIGAQFSHRLIPDGDKTFTLHLLDSKPYKLTVHNLGEEPGYNTKDVLEEHPTLKGHYRVLGRVDDQVQLSGGLKVNSLPIERILASSQYISAVTLFGTGKPYLGALVEPSSLVPGDHSSNEFLDAIWSTILEANNSLPNSPLDRRYIIIVKEKLPKGLKGYVKRSVAWEMYKGKIDRLYE